MSRSTGRAGCPRLRACPLERRLLLVNLGTILREIVVEADPQLGIGKVADYIPALAAADPRQFGIALTTIEGDHFEAGNAQRAFSIQSISKVFTLTMALELVGPQLWSRVGREPSGTPFNSLVQLEYEHGIPRNPFINPGAMIVTDVILSHCAAGDGIGAILRFVRGLADDETIRIDPEVARSEKAYGHRNVALASLMKNFGNVHNNLEDVLDIYFHQCALEMNCGELSRSLPHLANDGVDPLTHRTVVAPERARRINSLMLTCGHYDASGDFAFRVGLPGKSGVGGGIVAVVPGRLAIAVWSPALNPQGSSHAGTLALEAFAAKTGFSVF